MKTRKIIKLTFIVSIFLIFVSGCGAFKFKKVDTSVPMSGEERAKKNILEGRGVSLGNLRNSNTTYEFNTSNPLWRASLETLDFLPLSVVDYSGGIIISDWYNAEKDDSLKITIRFLSNEVRSDSIKIIVHKKKCSVNLNCDVNIFNSRINDELIASILKKAAALEKEIKKK